MKKLAEIFFVLTHPSYWLMNHTYSKEWEDVLMREVDLHGFVMVDRFEAKVGKLRVWIENHPYASFYQKNGIQVRPSRFNIKKLHDRLIADLIKNINETN